MAGTPFTRNSAFDNLRPVIPKWDDRRTAIAWMRGGYMANHGEWYSAVVAAIIPSAGERGTTQSTAERRQN